MCGHVPDFDEARHMHAIGRVDQLGHARDLFRLIPDTLEIGDGLYHRHDHPQVPRRGLAARDDRAAVLVD